MSRPALRSVLVALVLVTTACGTDGSSPASPGTTSTTAAGADDSTAPDESTSTTQNPPPDTSTEGVGWWPADASTLDPSSLAVWSVEVISTAPHDTTAFTQGLEELDDGRLLESTGLRGFSDVRIVDPMTGVPEVQAELTPDEFGEGLTVVDDTVIQLTWQAGVARRWLLPNLEPLESFVYDGDGWGLCLLDEERLAMSDGTSTLTFRDPATFSVIDTVTVRLDGVEVERINELECVDGLVVANVWRTSQALVIRPDGAVMAEIDASLLVDTIDSDDPNRDVLNGIAAHPDGTFSFTGKLWPTRFIVRLVAA